ncbi:hypothetical protein QC762_0012190 [Podospora pseudocomata]|uniref:Uncharacterized protein n=1 Tax=Podospora pseudocomata TaxID=2093779 RepID=A0ABR0GVI9_9PEZI|nr:hypothetical protein QC762_0012190 [Podospora pseudocomata]
METWSMVAPSLVIRQALPWRLWGDISNLQIWAKIGRDNGASSWGGVAPGALQLGKVIFERSAQQQTMISSQNQDLSGTCPAVESYLPLSICGWQIAYTHRRSLGSMR